MSRNKKRLALEYIIRYLNKIAYAICYISIQIKAKFIFVEKSDIIKCRADTDKIKKMQSPTRDIFLVQFRRQTFQSAKQNTVGYW